MSNLHAPDRKPLISSGVPPPYSRFAGVVRGPGQFMCPNGLVLEDLDRAIARWLYLHKLRSTREDAPRFLVIQGEPGTGKTVGACDSALRHGYLPARVPDATFASPNEGGATAILDDLVADLELQSRKHRAPIVAVFDDFDLSIISLHKETGHTVNSGLLVAHLQHYADNRNLGRNADGSTIPICVTGNDFTHMRASLFRDKRAAWHTHAPTQKEKRRLAHHVLNPQDIVERHVLDILFETYKDQPIAFWSALKSDLDAKSLDDIIARGLDADAAEEELARPRPLDPPELWALAKARAAANVTSFL